MASRPSLGDCRSPSHDTLRSRLPSPRREHFDGEVPPTLSPLDAFAAQGRLLARQLDESKRRDRRMSRLPPSSVERSLSQPRPNYFRSQSSGDSGLARQPTQKINPEVEEPHFRPQSEYPRLSGVSNVANEHEGTEDQDATPRHEPTIPRSEADDMEMMRVESPEEDLSMRGSVETCRHPADAPVGVALTEASRNSSTDSTSRPMIPRTLAPPLASPLPRPSSSSRVMNTESSDDDYSSSNAGSTFSKPRKLSSSSNVSVPQSPMSVARSRPHSPSISSEASNNAAYLPRPSFNFSRPISRSSTSLSAPVPAAHPDQAPPTSQQSRMSRGSKPSPIVVPSASDMAKSGEGPSSAVSSYVYTKYPLPRERDMPRDSVIFSGLQTPHFEWQEPLFESTTPPRTEGPERQGRMPFPAPTRAESVYSRQASFVYDTAEPGGQHLTAEARSQRTPSPDAGGAEQMPTPKSCPTTPNKDEQDSATSSADSASTARPQTSRAAAPSTVVSAEDHLATGIDCHEKGSLKESTYHLRIAAKQNHPTAMLLYALACRHGWGMRKNQREGVQWLRKALDSVGVELMDESQAAGNQKARELQKAYRAQFALSVYELGVSHLNGWGIEQDKALALRCFEIAAQWGDVDAMAETGFCYSEAVGCKKDLKKAARFYRMAEAHGMNMVGNSW